MTALATKPTRATGCRQRADRPRAVSPITSPRKVVADTNDTPTRSVLGDHCSRRRLDGGSEDRAVRGHGSRVTCRYILTALAERFASLAHRTSREQAAGG